MSYYYSKIKAIIDSQKNASRDLHNYYTDYTITKLSETKNPKHNTFLLFKDLINHLKNHSLSKTNIILHKIDKTSNNFTNLSNQDSTHSVITDKNNKNIIEIKNRLFYLKSLHLRAIILDLVENDYSSDELFYKPDKWIYDVIDEIECTFDGMIDFMQDFNEVFMETCKVIFGSKNKLFGNNGNLLVMNFMVYKKWALEKFVYDFNEFFLFLDQFFGEDRRMSDNEIMGILEEYEKGNKNDNKSETENKTK